MSWLISDDANVNNEVFNSYKDGNFYNQDSFRLAKNIPFIGPGSQTWQQAIDLDRFISTNTDFGFTRKFTGFTFKTSDTMPDISDPVTTTFDRDTTQTHERDALLAFGNFRTMSSGSGYHFYEATAEADEYIRFRFTDCYSEDSDDDCYFFFYINEKLVKSFDGDSKETAEFTLNAGDKLSIKLTTRGDHKDYEDYSARQECYFDGYVKVIDEHFLEEDPKIEYEDHYTAKCAPIFEYLPMKNKSLKKANFGVTNYINRRYLTILENVTYYSTGYFVAERGGTVDIYVQGAATFYIHLNGKEDHKGWGTNDWSVIVEPGDVVLILMDIPFSFDGPDGTACYRVDYNDVWVSYGNYYYDDKNRGPNSITKFVTSLSTDYQIGYDCAFICTKAGQLSISFNDTYEGDITGTSDGAVSVFINGERKTFLDADNDTESETLNIGIGDCVLIRRSTFQKMQNFNYIEYDVQESPRGAFSFSFSGEAIRNSYSHTYTWKEYVALVLAEARNWVDMNNLSDYALPVCLIDDADNYNRVSEFIDCLKDSGLNVDLWIETPLDGDRYDELESLMSDNHNVKCFNIKSTAGEEGYQISRLLRDCYVEELRINGCVDGSYLFSDTSNTTVRKLALKDISGDWEGAFQSALTSSCEVDWDAFSTSGLTSAPFMFRDSPLKDLTPERLKNFFNDTYELWQEGDYDFRTAFINSPYSGTVPEKFLDAGKQYACDWDPITLIKGFTDAYDITRRPATSYFTKTDSVYDVQQYYQNFSKVVHSIEVKARQFDETHDTAATITIDGKDILFSTTLRGHTIGVIDPKSMTIKYKGHADTYFGESTVDIWNTVINTADDDDIIFALSFDATSRTDAERQFYLQCGGHTSYGTWVSQKYAHAFLGKKNLGSNNGFEHIIDGDSYAVVNTVFSEDYGLMNYSGWKMPELGVHILKDPRKNYHKHFYNMILAEVPEEYFYLWHFAFYQIEDCYKLCGFEYTNNKLFDLGLSFLTSGAEKQINPNESTSASVALNYIPTVIKNNAILHIANVQGTKENVSIENMFSGVKIPLHCVGNITNITDITKDFYGTDISEVYSTFDGVEIADSAFENSKVTHIELSSSTLYSAPSMFKNCDTLASVDITGMTALKDASSMFEGCDKLFVLPTLPDNIEVARRMFANCSIQTIEGNWVQPNSYTTFRQQKEESLGELVDVWTNEATKDGWAFPSKLSSAYQMFYGNKQLTKVSNLRFNKNANNSWIFQDCSSLKTMQYTFLDIDAYDNNKYTGMLDGCALTKDNVFWLPISISSSFDLKDLGFMVGSGNELPTWFAVDDFWCEVDNSGFVEYQHIRRPVYLKVYKDNYDENVIIKFWSHIHLHSADKRGYNELHDAKVYYDPDTVWNKDYIDYDKLLKKSN